LIKSQIASMEGDEMIVVCAHVPVAGEAEKNE
jgi:hypothetical protein